MSELVFKNFATMDPIPSAPEIETINSINQNHKNERVLSIDHTN